jgi:hypothetical protein
MAMRLGWEEEAKHCFLIGDGIRQQLEKAGEGC